jgi:hypothetical protein
MRGHQYGNILAQVISSYYSLSFSVIFLLQIIKSYLSVTKRNNRGCYFTQIGGTNDIESNYMLSILWGNGGVAAEVAQVINRNYSCSISQYYQIIANLSRASAHLYRIIKMRLWYSMAPRNFFKYRCRGEHKRQWHCF